MQKLLKCFRFERKNHSRVTISDTTKIRLNTKTHRLELKVIGYNRVTGAAKYSLDTDLTVTTWLTTPVSVKQWLTFAVDPLERLQPDGTSVRFKLNDGTDNYWWSGAAWVVAGATDWNDEESRLYSAAYDEMTYIDSTDDGVEGETLDFGVDTSDFELQAAASRLGHRLMFHTTLARMWRHAAICLGASPNGSNQRREVFNQWSQQASAHCNGLLALLAAVHQYQIAAPSGENDSMVEYDRRRMIKEVLIERIVSTSVEMRGAQRLLRAAGGDDPKDNALGGQGDRLSGDELRLLRGVLAGDAEAVRATWSELVAALRSQEILYIPLTKGGNPRRNVRSRALGQFIYDLVGWLPRLGLLRETQQLLETVQLMESKQPVGPGAITEFDRLFENGYKSIVRCLVASADLWDARAGAPSGGETDHLLVDCLKQLTEVESRRWLRHSRTVRLSVVEKVAKKQSWNALVKFACNRASDCRGGVQSSYTTSQCTN